MGVSRSESMVQPYQTTNAQNKQTTYTNSDRFGVLFAVRLVWLIALVIFKKIKKVNFT